MSHVEIEKRLSITTPLGAGIFVLKAFKGQEAMSRLFRFDLDLVSEKESIPFDSIVGKTVTIGIVLANGSQRYWNGFISRFSQGARAGTLTTYRAEMVPFLWFLTRTADCRIFQNKKAPDIIKTIFEELGFRDFTMRLQDGFIEREYCVQYRESDFDFVSRLMEEEGIFYYFEHSNGKHQMILGNSQSAYDVSPQATVRVKSAAGGWSEEDVMTESFAEQEIRPGAWTSNDYNFEIPDADLLVKAGDRSKYEIYEYPGDYQKRNDGDNLARIRLQEQTAPGFILRGAGVCRSFDAGYTFDLIDHYRADLNQSYLLTSVQHTGNTAAYTNTFECIPAKTVFRPLRVTAQPVVRGCQTAVVVGPAGEEIFTDKYGRVKVQFRWDREGKLNENSSCWIRVSASWAGKGWGSINLPRIGQEVIVDFLEGDPDRPLIVGRLYNAQQMPPFGLPGASGVSGVKSDSTKGGGGFNEISLNDTKNAELIQIHAQRDMVTRIEHDGRLVVANNRSEEIGADESIVVGGNRTEKVVKNENIAIGGNQDVTVRGSQSNVGE